MRQKLVIAILLPFLMIAAPAAAFERASDEEMMEMLKLSGAVDVLVPMMNQLVTKVQTDIRRNAPSLPEEAHQAISEELQAGSRMMLKEVLAVQIDYYKARMTRHDVLELMSMYKSTAWKNYIAVGKQYMQEQFQTVMQVLVPKLSSDLVRRVRDRLVADGYLDAKEDTL
jgi:hypothetical protein